MSVDSSREARLSELGQVRRYVAASVAADLPAVLDLPALGAKGSTAHRRYDPFDDRSPLGLILGWRGTEAVRVQFDSGRLLEFLNVKIAELEEGGDEG